MENLPRESTILSGWVTIMSEWVTILFFFKVVNQPAMSDAKKRRFGAVVCWRFDRFARSTKHLLTALEEFRHLGIDFISYQENIDTGSPLGKAIFTIVSAISELERNIIAERIRGGIRRAKEKGKTLDRPKRLNLDKGTLGNEEPGSIL